MSETGKGWIHLQTEVCSFGVNFFSEFAALGRTFAFVSASTF